MLCCASREESAATTSLKLGGVRCSEVLAGHISATVSERSPTKSNDHSNKTGSVRSAIKARIMPGLVSTTMRGEISWRLWSLSDSLLGAAVGASFLYGAAAIYLRARGVEGMGFGDVKLMAMIGAFLGTKLTVLTIFASSLAGSLFGLSTVLAVWLKRTRRNEARGTTSVAARKRAWQSARLALRYYEMPFGVFLGAMAILSFLFGDRLMHWYWRAL